MSKIGRVALLHRATSALPFSSGLRKLAVVAAVFPAKRDDCQGLEVPLAYRSSSSQPTIGRAIPSHGVLCAVAVGIKLTVNPSPVLCTTAPERCHGAARFTHGRQRTARSLIKCQARRTISYHSRAEVQYSFPTNGVLLLVSLPN